MICAEVASFTSISDGLEEFNTVEMSRGISIIIPTYKEAQNIPHILDEIDQLRQKNDLTLEVMFMDDNSQDGSVEAVSKSGFEWARIVERDGPRGLSQSVIDGFERAQYPVLVCMDCDLSHPVDAIPKMIQSLANGHQFALGSRNVSGASVDDEWGAFRYVNTYLATLLARPLTKVRDPMSGFFALRREDFDNACDLNPTGYKIGLELIVKCGFDKVAEIPIHFADRVHGESKMSLNEQLKYLLHVQRLYMFSFANIMTFLQFLVVGTSGVFVNLTVLSLLLMFGAPSTFCLAGGIIVSMFTNFWLNRRYTFSDAATGDPAKQFIGFMSVSTVAMAVNYVVAISVHTTALVDQAYGLQGAALTGIAFGMVVNYVGSRYFVFRKPAVL